MDRSIYPINLMLRTGAILFFFIFYIGLHAQVEKTLVESGNSLYQLKDFHGAIEAYNKAIEINPEYSLAYNNRGIVKTRMGNDPGAVEDFTSAIEFNPEFFLAYINRASSRYNMEDYYEAIKDYSKAIELKEDYAPAWYGRGVAHIQINYMVGACTDLNKALELGNEDAAALIEEYCR